MNIVEMYNLVKEIYKANEYEYRYIGLRFEDKERQLNEICNNSKHNEDREDERDFPSFDSEDYEEMHELDGTSTWNIETDDFPGFGGNLKGVNLEKECSCHFLTQHCYIVASDRLGSYDVLLDENEILIKDAKVIAQLF